ncbi:pyridoxal phosphate-dependent transferase [Lipomyces oligophaga]|uniref:pyridoxal phosphate-dependent transferase n=1 Tax=Lipomyces oligophaga TaxID=45792 RepID=UPI0034CE4D3B
MSDLDLATLGVHADDELALLTDVAAPLHLTSTFHHDPRMIPAREHNILLSGPGKHIYSRFGNPVIDRVEAVLSSILGGHVVVYGSGLSAFTGAMLYYSPARVAIDGGYHGCHNVLGVLNRVSGQSFKIIDHYSTELDKDDVFHVETPINPTGEAIDLAKAAEFAHSRGAHVVVDATFGPPPVQDPFAFGADLVLHSATKYFGGHSDLLAGLLVTKDSSVRDKLLADRGLLGLQPGNLEAWLLLRSLRTYKIRLEAQCRGALEIVQFLAKGLSDGSLPTLDKVYHSSLQTDSFVATQMPNGLYNPTFSIEVKSAEVARALPPKLKLFHHATSLGGVESLIEWRAMTDPHVSETLLRISVGVEDPKDLIHDLQQALS